MPQPTSTQIGSIAENLVANALMVASHGRLSPFWPVADDDGIDLLIYDKESGRALPAQVKSRTVALKRRGSAKSGEVVFSRCAKRPTALTDMPASSASCQRRARLPSSARGSRPCVTYPRSRLAVPRST